MKLFLLITTIMLCCSLPLVGIADSTSTHTAKEKQEPHNADYYYNQAVSYFDSGNQAYANLYYLKALNLNSAHKQARANLELSIRLSADSKLYPQHKFLVNATYRMLWFFSVNRLAIISLILLLLASLCLAWLLFYDPDKRACLAASKLHRAVSYVPWLFHVTGLQKLSAAKQQTRGANQPHRAVAFWLQYCCHQRGSCGINCYDTGHKG